MPQIKNADGTIRDADWPPAGPTMLNDIRDAKNEQDRADYAAFKAANGGLKSYSYMGKPTFDGRIQRKNNTTGEIEWVNA
jgi:hypothetical protein